MKKYLFLALLFVPMVSLAAPSVRMLGSKAPVTNQASVKSTGTTTPAPVKATPAKASNSTAGNSVASRVGTVRAKTKTTGVTSNAVKDSGSESRFPMITTGYAPYNSVVTLKPTGGTISAEVDTDAIVDTVMEKVENNYYNKTEVYSTNEFIEAVKDVDNELNYSVSTSNPRTVFGKDAPEGWVYIWVEE